jgi:hypothetical protein
MATMEVSSKDKELFRATKTSFWQLNCNLKVGIG